MKYNKAKNSNHLIWKALAGVVLTLIALAVILTQNLSPLFLYGFGVLAIAFIALMATGFGFKQAHQALSPISQSLDKAHYGVAITDKDAKLLWHNDTLSETLSGVPLEGDNIDLLETLQLYLASEKNIEPLQSMHAELQKGFHAGVIASFALPEKEAESRYILATALNDNSFLWTISASPFVAQNIAQQWGDETLIAMLDNATPKDTKSAALSQQTISRLKQRLSFRTQRLPAAWFSMDAKGKILDANQQFANIIGLNTKDLLSGNHFFANFLAEDIKQTTGMPSIQSSKEQVLNAFVSIRTKGNEPFKGLLIQNADYAPDGEILATNSVLLPLKEIPQEKPAKQETVAPVIKTSAIDLQRTAANLVKIDQGYNIVDASTAFCNMVGSNNLQKMPFASLFPALNKEHLHKTLYDMAAQNNTSRSIPLGAEASIKLTPVWLDEQQGDMILLASMIEEKAALDVAEKELIIGKMAGGTIHNVKNALTPIMMGTEHIMEGIDVKSPLYSHMQIISESANRAFDVVQRLNKINRSIAGEKIRDDLNLLISDLKNPIEIAMGPKVNVAVKRSNDVLGAEFDLVAFEQIIMNLVTNAKDAMPSGGHFLIQGQKIQLNEQYAGYPDTVPYGFWTTVTLSDTGSGMDSATLEQIFKERFTTKQAGKGTGLGLTSVLDTMHSLSGYVTVNSTIGEGTSFTLWLPHIDAHQIDAKAQTPIRDAEDLSGRGHILLVEDEIAVLDYTKIALERKGYTVDVAHNGNEGLRAIEQQNGRYDLVISDIAMPEMDGAVMLAYARQQYPNLNCLLVSGNSEESLEHDIITNGLQQVPFLAKPYRADDILRKVKQLMPAVAVPVVREEPVREEPKAPETPVAPRVEQKVATPAPAVETPVQPEISEELYDLLSMGEDEDQQMQTQETPQPQEEETQTISVPPAVATPEPKAPTISTTASNSAAVAPAAQQVNMQEKISVNTQPSQPVQKNAPQRITLKPTPARPQRPEPSVAQVSLKRPSQSEPVSTVVLKPKAAAVATTTQQAAATQVTVNKKEVQQTAVRKKLIRGQGSAPVVVYADDDPLARLFPVRAMKKAGFNVIEMEDGPEALEYIQNNHVDLLLTDIQMILMDGPELAEKAWAHNPLLPIIFTSGNLGELKDKVRSDRESYFVEKPPKQLPERIAYILYQD